MTILNRTSIHHWKMIFDGIPEVEFYLKSVTLPGISVPSTDASLPTYSMPLPGRRVEYDPITIVYSLDENWITWKSLYDWINGFATDQGYIRQENQSDTMTALLLPLDNHNTIIGQIEFGGVFPTFVETPALDYTNPTFQDVEITATLAIQGFECKLNKVY